MHPDRSTVPQAGRYYRFRISLYQAQQLAIDQQRTQSGCHEPTPVTGNRILESLQRYCQQRIDLTGADAGLLHLTPGPFLLLVYHLPD